MTLSTVTSHLLDVEELSKGKEPGSELNKLVKHDMDFTNDVISVFSIYRSILSFILKAKEEQFNLNRN